MRRDPFGRQRQRQAAAPRRGFNPRILILLAFLGYGAYYWFSNRTLDPVTGEKVLIDRSLSVEDEKALGYGYLLPYARKHETEADHVGLMLAAAACYDPRESVPLWQRMSAEDGGQSQPEFASTHPNPGTRIQNLQSLMPKAMEYRDRFCDGGALSTR